MFFYSVRNAQDAIDSLTAAASDHQKTEDYCNNRISEISQGIKSAIEQRDATLSKLGVTGMPNRRPASKSCGVKYIQVGKLR